MRVGTYLRCSVAGGGGGGVPTPLSTWVSIDRSPQTDPSARACGKKSVGNRPPLKRAEFWDHNAPFDTQTFISWTSYHPLPGGGRCFGFQYLSVGNLPLLRFQDSGVQERSISAQCIHSACDTHLDTTGDCHCVAGHTAPDRFQWLCHAPVPHETSWARSWRWN